VTTVRDQEQQLELLRKRVKELEDSVLKKLTEMREELARIRAP
jgi:hypothetical protein